MDSPTFGIEKFDGKNGYNLWRVKMRALLVQQGLIKALKGKEELPESLSEEEKEDMVDRAYSFIILSLSDEVLREVVGETTPSGLWLRLDSLYMRRYLRNRLYLKLRLFKLRMSEGTSISDHLDEFNRIILDLKSAECEIDDETQAMVLLGSLPPSFGRLVDTVLCVPGRKSISVEEVKDVLISEELRRKVLRNQAVMASTKAQ